MNGIASRFGVAALLLATAALTAACGGAVRASSPTGEALGQIRAQVEGQRQCTPLLSGTWPIEFSADALSGRGVDALVGAGLVRRVPIPVPAGERQRVRIDLTDAGRRDARLFPLDPEGPSRGAELCYGRKHVVDVRFDRVGPETARDNPAAEENRVRYDYRVVDPPVWTARSDIRAAFPWIERELGATHTAEGAAFFKDGRWQLSSGVGPDTTAELPSEDGFLIR